jgi:hypothetical protein
MMAFADYAEIAYNGYFKACDGKSLISGQPLPKFKEQREDIQKAWEEAAKAVLQFEKTIS